MINITNFGSEITQNYMKENSENPFAVRVKGLLKAYGKYPLLYNFWYQRNSNGSIVSYIIKYGSEFIADISNKADSNNILEIIDLCSMAGGTALLCKKTNISVNSEIGVVMKWKNHNSIKESICFTENSINLKEYYNILKSNSSKDFVVPNFNDFYVDLNHRIRKGVALLTGMYVDNKLVSCCAVTSLYSNSAVIAGVSTLPNMKNKGYGSTVVLEMCNRLLKNGISNIWLQRDKNKNFSFYNKLGFEDISEFEQINLI